MAFDPSTIAGANFKQLDFDSSLHSSDLSDQPFLINVPHDWPGFDDLEFSPSHIDTELWLDADDSDSITHSSNAVSQWSDKSGNNRHATQTTEASKPTLSASSINGKSSIYFNNDLLSLTGLNSLTEMSIFAVVQIDNDTPSAGGGGLWLFSSNTTNNTHYPYVTDGVIYDCTGSTTRKTVGNPSPSLASPRIYNVNSKASAWTSILDGTELHSTVTNTVGIGSTSYIGASDAAETTYLQGNIAEIIILDTFLSATDRVKIEGYLAHKWGLTANLPTDHAWEDQPPSSKKKICVLDSDKSTQLPVEIEHWQKGPTPVSRWDFDNIVGSTLEDVIGTDDGTITNMTDTSGGPFDRYLAGGLIASTIRNIDFGASTSFKAISLWFKRTSTGSHTYLLHHGTYPLYVWPSASGNLLKVYDGTTENSLGFTISDTTIWHNLVIVEGSDNNTHWAYLDGVKGAAEASSNFSGVFRYFGYHSTETVSGQDVADVTNIQVFDFKLTAAQVTMLYNAGHQYTPNKAILHSKKPTVTAASDDVAHLGYDETQDDNTTYVGDTGDAAVESFDSGATWAGNWGAADITYRWLIEAAALTSVSGEKIRVKFDRHTSDYDIDEAWIMLKASSGDAYDGETDSAEQLKFGGSASTTITTDNLYSDPVDFEIDGTTGVIVSVYFSDASGAPYSSSGITNGTRYYKSSVNEAGDENVTGFTSTTTWAVVDIIESVPPAQSVWPSAYKGRWGMSQDPSGTAPQLLDSTGTYDGTMAGTMLTEDLVDGLVGLGWDFEGTDDSVTTASAIGLTAYPIVFFSKFELDNLTAAQPLVSGDDASNYIGLSVWIDTNGAVNVRMGDGTGVTSADHYTWKTANSVIAATTEYTLELLVTNFTTVVLYVDGSVETLSFSAGTGASADLSNALYRIGTSAADSTFIDGKIYDMFLGSFALTAGQAALQNASLTDALLTWSDYSGSRLQYWDLLYADPANTEHVAYWDESYALLNYLTPYWDQIYGVLLTTYWDFDYGNSPLIKAFFDQLYGDNRIVKQWWDLPYENRSEILRYWELKYNINKGILQHWDEAYTLSAKGVTQYFDQAYDIKATNQLLKYFDEYYHIMADSVVEPAALGFYIDGVKYEGPFHVSFELNKDSYKNTGEMQFNYPAPYFAASEGSELRIVDTDIDLYLEVTIPTKSETTNQTTYVIPAESKSRILETANVFTEEFTDTTAETIVTTIANRQSITVDWQILDWPIAEYQVNDLTPYQAIHRITEAAKAVIQSDFDGNIYVCKSMESDSHMWDSDTPTYLLEDNLHFFSTNQSGNRRPGYNKYRASDQSSSDETRTTLEDDEYGVARRIVKAFRVPWDGVALTLETSDNNATIQYLDIMTENIEEAISVISGEGESKTRKPAYSVVSWSYNDTNLGTPTVTEEGVVQTPTAGNSLLTLTYTTKYYKWLVTDYDDPEIQVWVRLT